MAEVSGLHKYGALPNGASEAMAAKAGKLGNFREGLFLVGLGTPLSRFVLASSVSAIIIMAARPRWCFRENGEMRPFKHPFCTEEDAVRNHFFLVPTLTGLAFSQLI
jgi:hypothetical protein